MLDYDIDLSKWALTTLGRHVKRHLRNPCKSRSPITSRSCAVYDPVGTKCYRLAKCSLNNLLRTMSWQETFCNTMGRNGEQRNMDFLVPVRHHLVHAFIYINVNYAGGAFAQLWIITFCEKEEVQAQWHRGPVCPLSFADVKSGSWGNVIPNKEMAERSRMWGWHYTKAVTVLLLLLFPSLETMDHTMRSTTSLSAHTLKAELCFRICTEELVGIQNSPRKCWLNFRPHDWEKWMSLHFVFQGQWVVTSTQLLRLSSNRENIQLCIFSLFMGNFIYFCEFLNIYNPFIEDLLGVICLLWEVKERPRKWFSILSAS